MPSAVRRRAQRRTRAPGPPLTRLILVAGLLAGAALPALLPATATASPATVGAASAASAARTPQPVVAITSMSRPFASPGQKVVVHGTVTNTGRAKLSGVTVQLLSSGSPFLATEQMQTYAAGKNPAAVGFEARAMDKLRGTLAPGATTHWTAVLPVNEVGMSRFGVYPLAAQATDSLGAVVGTSWSFLPFWPSAKSKLRPQRDDVAWIWPLIDTPDQGPCPDLLNNHLASSLASGGRLARLLSTGAGSAGQAAKLTWVIDPALLSTAATMAGGPHKSPYRVGAKLGCGQAKSYPASSAARSWLAGLSTAVRTQPSFTTPYADADIAALISANLGDDLHQAYAHGRSEAKKILGPKVVPTGSRGSGPASLISAAAWPANGMASYPMLENLAAADGIKTVVLSTAAMPPRDESLSYTPSAVTHTPDGVGGQMRVLLADADLSQILGQAGAARSPAARFTLKQFFLAQTAMLASQAPNLSRAIVIAPPRRWNPPKGLAGALLSETSHAPWLSPTSAGSLAADRRAPGQAARQQPIYVGRSRFNPPLTSAIVAADRGIQLVQGLRATPAPQLTAALASVESSAWPSTRRGRRPARAILRRINAYVSNQENGVSIIGDGRTTLGGQKGSVPVSIDNRLDYAVRVRIRLIIDQAPDRQFTVLSGSGVRMVTSDVAVTDPIEVKPQSLATTKLQVKATGVGTTQIEMRLLNAHGQPVPGAQASMSVKTTHFGTFALVILAAALGIFMITSAGRAVRRGRTPGTDGEDSDDQHGQPPVPDPDGQETQVSSNEPARSGARDGEQPEEADNVGHDRARSDAAGTDQLLTEDADDDARVPGWAYRG
jgi:Family of unknown function (DUF6049)